MSELPEHLLSDSVIPRPSDFLREVAPEVADSFKSLRIAVANAGPLDYKTCELILLASFATVGYEVAVKIHAIRIMRMGVPKAALRQAVLFTLGATTTLMKVTQALKWIDEAEVTLRDHTTDGKGPAAT